MQPLVVSDWITEPSSMTCAASPGVGGRHGATVGAVLDTVVCGVAVATGADAVASTAAGVVGAVVTSELGDDVTTTP